jgi:hypothetical protein
MSTTTTLPPIYGVVAEFDSAQKLVDATAAAKHAGYNDFEAYSPFPIEAISEIIGFKTKLPAIVLAGGITGGLAGFGMCFFANAIHYPLIIGGKPLNAWPAWIPITFELTVLFAAFSAVIGMFALNGFPQPYHPLFNVQRFELATREKFFLCIESKDPKFDAANTRAFLQTLHASEVTDVPW